MLRMSLSMFVVLGLATSMSTVACSSSSSEGDEPAAQPSAWDAESADDESKSTHLWIVNRGIVILAKHDDEAARRLVLEMNAPDCRKSWQQGLLDADFKAEFNNGRRDLHPGA